jgi:hypothetical protein
MEMMEYLNFIPQWHNLWMVISIGFVFFFDNSFLVRLHESMRELEQLRSKPELTVATLLGLIHAHKQHKTPGRDLISNISSYFFSSSGILDREAIGEYEAKVKELRKQVDDTALFYAAHTLYIIGKPDKATEYIDRSTKQNPTNVLVIHHRFFLNLMIKLLFYSIGFKFKRLDINCD